MSEQLSTKKPTLVLIDIQQEYISPGSPFHLDGILPSLENCRLILAHARQEKWPILHVQHVTNGSVFSGQRAQFIEGFAPAVDEPVFQKSQTSPYTNEAFKSAMLSAKESEALIIGYGSTQCCMSTVISGAAIGLRHSFVKDASWARTLADDISEAQAHRHATAIIGIHGNIRTTEEVLAM